MVIINPIIPQQPVYIHNGVASTKAPHGNEFDYKSIAVWAAIGFFLGDTTFYKDVKVLQPSCTFENGKVTGPDWQWHYSPRDISLPQAVDEFAHLFEKLVKEQTSGKKIILPISGGLDSRSLAVACAHQDNVSAYSYKFKNGINETKYGKKIARCCGFPFNEFMIKPGYLWNVIEELAILNQCYTEFTHPRPMAVIDKVSLLGDIFLLGHWGDVLFDDMHVSDDLGFDSQVEIVLKKIVKKGGIELAASLWVEWGLKGDFKQYLYKKVAEFLNEIKIDNANARIRAFKSLHWAPRWANSSMRVFTSHKPVAEPYYSDEMCRFICTIPEHLLAGRQIQIEYIKQKSPDLAKIIWQDHRPFNIYNFHWDKSPWNLIYRTYSKIKRTFGKERFVQRNWELQFCGEDNDAQLRHWIFDNKKLNNLVSKSLIKDIYNKFLYEDVTYSHSVSMLLTLSLFTYGVKYDK